MVNVLSIVSYKFLPPQMGGQKGIALFYKYLSSHLNLTCVTIKDNDPSLVKEYEILNIFSNGKLRYVNIFYFFKLRKIVKQRKVTHVILEHPYWGWLGLLLKWFCGIKLVIHSHNIEGLRFKTINKWWWGILWNYERFVHGRADLNFFIQDADLQYAIVNFKLSPKKCATITYGIEITDVPTLQEKSAAKNKLFELFNIDTGTQLLLFNGTLNYRPNRDALDIILGKINPLLLLHKNFVYKIIITGSKLPEEYNKLIAYKEQNIIYAGFVDDITTFLKGADIFLNPVTDGGGIKTKIVEALGYDLAVISTKSGAIGIPVEITGGKMKIIEDDKWEEFAENILKINTDAITPTQFFDHFYWDKIAIKAAHLIKEL